MKKNIWLAAVFVCMGSASAVASGIPAGANTFRRLDCTAHFDGQYQNVQKVVIRDVTYKTPPAPWDNFNSAADVYLPDGSVLEGVLNESNGNDPQDYRDSAPAEYSGTGGVGMYPISSDPSGNILVLMTKSTSNQRDLSRRQYDAQITLVDGTTGNPVPGTASAGTLDCQVTR
jgi:hypothetical protein